MKKFFFIGVILPINLEKVYTYYANYDIYKKISIGSRVIVNFGKSKFYTAIVYNKHQKKLDYETKPIENVLDSKPIITKNNINLWEWIAKYYMCNLGQVYNIAIPSAMKLKSETIIKLEDNLDEKSIEKLSDKEYMVWEALNIKSGLSIKQIDSIVGKNSIILINNLIKKNIVKDVEVIEDKYIPIKKEYISISSDIKNKKENMDNTLNHLKKYPAQRKVFFDMLTITASKNIDSLDLKKFIADIGTTNRTVKKLLEKNIFVLSSTPKRLKEIKEIDLDYKDEKIISKINDAFKIKKTALLYSHKKYNLKIYSKLIYEEIYNNKQVLLIVPEINLINKIQDKISDITDEDIVIYYHNRISQKNKINSWDRVLKKQENEGQLIIGTKQSIFLPFTNLGLIILEQEHSESYKQIGRQPLYNARDCAIMMSKIHNCKMLLSSYCPSLNSYNNSKINKYELIKSSDDNGTDKQNIKIIDLKAEKDKLFSKYLLDSISECYKSKKKVLIFQNRKGFAPIISCDSCGHSPSCKNCDVALTFYKEINLMKCNYCGFSKTAKKSCEACGGLYLKSIGVGVEQVELELKKIFDYFIIKRIDSEVKGSPNKIIDSFENGEIDILIGTQIISKIESDKVGLIVILQADNLLNIPDFRSFERTYQFILYMIRHINKKANTIIQTFNPNNKILNQVINNDYFDMADYQLNERKSHFYPPYCKIIKIKLKDRNRLKLDNVSNLIAKDLKKIISSPIFGPNYENIIRIKNYYIKNIIIKINNKDISKSKIKIKDTINRVIINGKFYSTKIEIDADL